MSNMTEQPAKTKFSLPILAFSIVGWLVFIVGVWNHNAIVTALALVIAYAVRSAQGRKLLELEKDTEMLSTADGIQIVIFGFLLWNHLVPIIVILLVLKAVVMIVKRRK